MKRENHSMYKTFYFILALFIIAIGGYPGAASALKAPKAKTATKNISNKIEQYKKRLESLLSPIEYRYVAAGKPDPFMPFFRTEMNKAVSPRKKKFAKKPETCATALECMDVGQLTLVGIVLEPDGNSLAMAQDASGIGYTLRLGTKIGYNNGKVVSITRDRVIVKEEVEDLRGRPSFRDRTLYLHPEEGDESR